MDTHRSPARDVTAFLVVAFALATSIAVLLPDAHINLLLSVLVPTVTVVVLTFTITPRGSRRALWREVGLGRAAWRLWPAALAIPVLLCGSAYGTALLVGAGTLHLDAPTASGTADLVLSMVLTTVILLGEEIGWRGYLLLRIQELTGERRRAAVLTGFAHGCFHLPLILLASTYDTAGSRWVAAPMAVAVITAGGVVYAWLRDRSGSVWPVTFAHQTVNTVFDLGAAAVTGSAVAGIAGETGWATLAAVVVAAALLLQRSRTWQPEPVAGPAPRSETVVAA